MTALTQIQVVELLRKKQGDRSLRQFAEDIGCSAPYLSDVYKLHRTPGPVLLKVLGLRRRTETKVTYMRESQRKAV